MTFARVKPAGWVDNELLTHAQINQLDINVSNAIDGAGGGANSPASDIQILGTKTIKTAQYTQYTTAKAEHRALSLVKLAENSGGSGTSWTTSGASGMWIQASEVSNSAIVFPIDLVEGAEFTGVRVWIKPMTGHGALPALLPLLKLLKVDPAIAIGSLPVVVSTAAEYSVTVGTYEAAHYIDVACSEVISQASGVRYFIEVWGEGSTNRVASLAIISAVASFAATEIHPG